MTEHQYIPGKCNLGAVEIRRRYRIGFIGTSIALIFVLIIHLFDLPHLKFLLFLPVYYALSGFIQARNKFCYIYGFKGVASVIGRKKFQKIRDDEHLKNIVQYFSLNPADMEKEVHSYAAKLLDQGKVEEAWQVLLSI